MASDSDITEVADVLFDGAGIGPDGTTEADVSEPDTADDLAPDRETGDVAPDATRDTSLPDIAPDAVAICGDGHTDAGEACDDGDLDDLDGCDRNCASTRSVRAPGPGEVVINELMVNPSLTADPLGEWIELMSLASDELNLAGCILTDDGTDRVALSLAGGLTLAPGALLVAASAPAATALKATVSYTTMLFDDAGDEVTLVCDGVVVDRIGWTPFAWPVIGGRALSLDPSRRDATANDDVNAWCAATTLYAGGERGTPGASNPACPHLDRAVDRCRLLGDALAVGFADAALGFEVEVEELGLTDLTPGVDASPELLVEVGSATGVVDPSAPDTFVWERAQPLVGYQAATGSRADVWRGEVTAAAGSRRVMARASRDVGASWRYCDRDGSDNGVSATELTTLTIGPSPCAAAVCATPPAAVCAADGVHREGFEAPGVCVPLSATTFDCDYPPLLSDCGLLGRVCESASGGAVCGAVPRTPALGDLVLAELMIRPTAPAGQWVELRSAAPEPLLLTGCVLAVTDADGTREWVLEAPTVIGPAGPRQNGEAWTAGLVVLGESDVFEDNGGVLVDRPWGEALGETGLPLAGTLALVCGEVLDTVTWDASWPGVTNGSRWGQDYSF